MTRTCAKCHKLAAEPIVVERANGYDQAFCGLCFLVSVCKWGLLVLSAGAAIGLFAGWVAWGR